MPIINKKTRKRIIRNNRGKDTKKSKYFLLIAFVIFIFSLILGQLRTRYWTSEDKLSVVTLDDQRNVHIIIINPVTREITKITVPESTQVNVSGNLGIWRLGSVWKLGENEGLDGELLVKTIAHQLKIPVYVWADEEFINLTGSNVFQKVIALFSLRKTNLSMSDRVHIFIFSLKVKDIKRTDINLNETAYLTESKLEDGEIGYVAKEDLPSSLKSLFFSNYLKNKVLRVLIRDHTGRFGVSEDAAEVIETLGADVAAVIREAENDTNCEIKSSDKMLMDMLANTFSCNLSKEGIEGNYDAEVILGGNFFDNF